MADLSKVLPISLDAQPELLALFEALTDVMFCLKNSEGTYLSVNSAFVRRTTKRTKQQVLGKTAQDIFQPLLAEKYHEQDVEVVASGEAMRDQLELIRRPGGELGWYVTTKIPVLDDGVVVGIASVSRDLHSPRSEAVAMESLSGVVEFVADHLQDSLRTADLAAVAGCSPGQLDRRMRRVFRLSPSQYILKARIQNAARLLEQTTMPIAEIAMECGFYDQAHFTGHFGKLLGETPAEFRSARPQTEVL